MTHHDDVKKKKKRPRTKLHMPPRAEDFISDDIESGKCLLCDEWIGVNGDHEHVHTVPSTELTSPHIRCELQTPHIIVSPEMEEQESLFIPPDEYEKKNEDKDKEILQQEEQLPTKSSSAPAIAYSAGKEQQPPTLEDQISDTKIVVDPLTSVRVVMEEQLKEQHAKSSNQPPQTTEIPIVDKEFVQNSSPDSSSLENSPTDDQGQPYFCRSNESPVEETVNQPEYPVHVMPSGRHRSDNNESLILCVSALYAKLVVVMGMAFPIAEIISDDVPLMFYNSFYLYLYFGSILFLIYAYLFLLRTKSFTTDAFKSQVNSIKMKIPRIEVNWEEIPMPDKIRHYVPKKKHPDAKSEKADKVSMSTSTYKTPKYTITESSNHGSMYLKMGAVIFGIGSMIYSGLEFGQYFELRSGANCANILMAISPVARMIFTFLQMYFIFLNSRVAISKHTIIARFGLMHMIGTNLCIWLNVLVQETKHEIAHLTLTANETGADLYPSHHSENDRHNAVLGGDSHHTAHPTNHSPHHVINDSLHQHPHGSASYNQGSDLKHNVLSRSVGQDDHSGCRRINLMGHVVNSASPFLFPCTIEYSLLCAGVLYVMWKNININKSERTAMDADSDISTFIARKVRHHYSVDCARASRGLFMGIFILVLTIISLILFYVLISNDQFKRFAILEANIIELSIYSLAIISVIVGMKQMRELEFILEGDIELDNILLIIAQAGVYIYTSFTIIGGYFSVEASHTLALLTAMMTLIQTTLQTLFILDGSRRCCYTTEQLDRKPGREMVTFLLVCNLAMWAISTFETSRADVHPTQLHFYGIWAWTIISHVSMPLAIFYRFHVTVCLGEIWKRSYKLKNDFIGL